MPVNMIRPYNNIIMYARVGLILVTLLVTGCTDDELPHASGTDAPVVADIAFTVSQETRPTTRMSAAVVQEEGQTYRGIEMQHIVPFNIASADKVTASDMPKAFQVYGNGQQPVGSRAYYYYENCTGIGYITIKATTGDSPGTYRTSNIRVDARHFATFEDSRIEVAET